ncbi:MAG TPA: endopeptidase La [Chloroflexia bacterium]|nr:endopeptidase La [Chloroflexia bacterium]
MPDDVARERLEFPLMPLKGVVVFPRTIVTLTVLRSDAVNAVEAASEGDRRMVVATLREDDYETASADDFYSVGTLVEVKQAQRQPEGGHQIEVEALRRVRIDSVSAGDRCLKAGATFVPEKTTSGSEVSALMSHLAELFGRYATMNNRVPAEAADHVRAARQAGYMADLLAAHLIPEVAERQKVLEMANQGERLTHMSGVLVGAIDLLETEQRVREKVRASIDKTQREFYLREQLKAIHDELSGEGGNEMAEVRDRLEKKGLPPQVLQRTMKEVSRLERMPSISPESTVLRNYLDWVLALPWNDKTVDRIDLPLAEQILEEDHYGLHQVKERILDFLAVRQLTLRRKSKSEAKGEEGAGKSSGGRNAQVLCFVGPPGVGKTSLGQSIARAMNRKFVRLSLGGVHDESEIRGHRRTYVGAMPGRIVQGMKIAETLNPVMLLDEVDKMTADMRGDPSAALLEVLDPAQNHTFVDHYLDVPYDLSDVLFIATANTLYNIPRPLRDRMEVIEIGGYTEEEKVQIARRHLLPKQVDVHGLETGFLEIPDRMLQAIIRTYTREAGVRDLERKLATICRKAARKVVQGRTTRVRVTPHNLEEFLGPARYRTDVDSRSDQVGVAMGLAWTEHGGELLPVEVATMPGRGSLTITGRLGDVMQESARAALSYARSRANELDIDLDTLEKLDLHIHLPEGAIPKDGPSAGITMGVALISAITRRAARSDVGMTGELTLTGRVLAIGGLKEKVLAAHRAGIRHIVAPLANKPDWAELPRAVRRDLEFTWVESMDQVIGQVLHPADSQPAVLVAGLDSEESKTRDTVDQAIVHEDDIAANGVAVPTADLDTPDQANGKSGRRAGRRRSKKDSESQSDSDADVDADAAAGPMAPFNDNSMYLPPQEG